MTRLIITADLHGSHGSWLAIKALLNPEDSLVVAGDLFDTKYGSRSNTDFQPEAIKNDLNRFSHGFYYVYGNCDTPGFFPGFDATLSFSAFNKKIFLYHGHRPPVPSGHIDIMIQGHTHLCSLEKKKGQIFMNPGSIACPRNGIYTYGMIDKTSANLIDLKTGDTLVSISF